VGLQDRDIEHMRRHHELCEWAKTHAPEKLDAIEYAHSRHLVEGIWRFNLGPKLTPKQKGELERQGYNWRGVGLIEYEFGGKGEAEWRKLPLSGAFSELYRPTCLDEILRSGVGKIEKLPGFTGGLPITTDTGTNMQRLQELFGMHRNRFYKYLRDSENTRSGRKRLYGYRHILQIMKGLLSENTRKRTAARGAPRRIWLSDPDDPNLRTRVLSGIAGRINSVSVSNDIGRAFLEVVRPHLSDSAKK